MTDYRTEAEVEALIALALLEAGCKSDVSVYSDTQGENTVIRKVVFKAAIALKGSSSIVDAVSDIGAETDRGVRYKGSQVGPSEQGEMRYLYFEANIDPQKDY